MKVIRYVCCLLALTYVDELANAESSQNKFYDQPFDVFPNHEEPLKIKRPFCNAFTGCGRKRSVYKSSTNAWDSGRKENVEVPAFLYKTLLRAIATQQIRDAVVHAAYDRRFPGTVSDHALYPARTMASDERRQS